jgi:hypothetical protein
MPCTLQANCRRGYVTCWQPCAAPVWPLATTLETAVQFLLNLTEPAIGLACSTLSTDLPTFFVDRIPSAKNNLSHKQACRIGQPDPLERPARISGGGRLHEAFALENDLQLARVQRCKAGKTGYLQSNWARLEVDGPRGKNAVELSLAEWCQEDRSESSAAENHPGTATACPLEPLQL